MAFVPEEESGVASFLRMLGLGPSDPNDPASVFQTPGPSQAETMFKLASVMKPLAPFIGGTRTPLGRILGAGAVIGGGGSEVLADLMEKRRSDPLGRKAAIFQSALDAQRGVRVPVPGAPEQVVPFPAAAADDFYTPPDDGGQPTLTIPAIPSTSRAPQSMTEYLANATPKQALATTMAMNLGMPADAFVREPKVVAGGHPLVDISDPINPREIYKPPITPDSEATNYANKLSAELARNPNDPVVQEKVRAYRYIHSNPDSPLSQRFAERIYRGINPDKAMEEYINDAKDIVTAKTTAGEKAKVEVKGTPAARAAAANIAQGSKEGELSVLASQEYRDAQAEIVAARETAKRLNARMSPDQERRFTQYSGINRNLDTIVNTYKPGYVGGIPAALGFQREMDKAITESLQSANEGKYSGGAIIGRLSNYWGDLPTDQARFYRALADNADRILRARSGQQINESEAKRLLQTVPNASDMPATFEAKFNDFAGSIVAEQKAMLEGITVAPSKLRDRPLMVPQVGQPSKVPPTPPGTKSKEDRLKALGFE